eukprot:GFUD01044110.1.p1 GENE.GFUD01044110.1~~GFUD01044110.1.p1  ORF type:complete len:186 (+),score=62.16 GFUD01044110.1:49-606(+)
MCIFMHLGIEEISEKELEAAGLAAVDHGEEEEDEHNSDEDSMSNHDSMSDESKVMARVGYEVLVILDNLKLETEMGVRDVSELRTEAWTRMKAVIDVGKDAVARIKAVIDGGLCEQAEVDQEDEEDKNIDEDSRSASEEEVECGSGPNKLMIMSGEDEVVGGNQEAGCAQGAADGYHDIRCEPQD